MGSQAKHWAFTLNNYTEDDERRIQRASGQVAYLVYGREVSSTGTPHLQGFVSLRKKLRLSQVRTLLGCAAHYEIARDPRHAAEYCKKDGDTYESGEPPRGRGSRSDLELFKDSVKAGCFDIKVLRETHSSVFARYGEFCQKYMSDRAPVPELPMHALRPWQANLNRKLNLSPDSRSIIFCVDKTGNTGKSWFAHYYTLLHRESNNVQVVLPGKKADMIYSLQNGLRVVFLDCPRSKQGDVIQYDFLEELKNGYLFSPKYYSEYRRFGPMHVCVMMNEDPDMTKLSADRYDLHDMNPN